jgi:hypothetical protein
MISSFFGLSHCIVTQEQHFFDAGGHTSEEG